VRVLGVDVGRKNLALCLLEPGACAKGRDDRVVRWTVTSADPSAAGIAAALAAEPWTLQCDEVAVERQPNRNPTMSRLQHYLEMYFAMHDKLVTVQDPKHKLAFAAATPWWSPDLATSWTYHARKKLAVATATAFLADTPQAADVRATFAGSAKKDDLADAALHAMAYAHHVRPLDATRRAMAAAVAKATLKPRKPTAKQQASGKFTKANIAHFFKGCPARDAMRAIADATPGLRKSVTTHFGSLDSPELLAALGVPA
jgi:hypothetical protein